MTVSAIEAAALRSQEHYCVRELAEQICHDLRSKDYLSEPIAIGNFVEANTRYTRDPRTVELVKAPHVVVQQLLAGRRPALDCDDDTALVVALGLAIGCEMDIVTFAFSHMFYKGQRQYSHVAARAHEPNTGVCVVVDPVAGPRTEQMLRRAVAAKVWSVA